MVVTGLKEDDTDNLLQRSSSESPRLEECTLLDRECRYL